MIASISKSTFNQYNSCYKKWWLFCRTHQLDPHEYNFSAVMGYLYELHNSEVSYSTLNCHRAALALIFTFNNKEQTILKRFMKGTFNIKPPTPRYSETWDPNPVLTYLEKLFPLESLSLENLTLKLVTLMILVSGHRVQTLSKISLKNIRITPQRVEVRISDKIKTSGPRRLQPFLIFPFFKEKPGLCIGSTIINYIEKTQCLRPTGCSELLLTYRKPHHTASTQSISRWIKIVLERSGIDTSIFSSHSTRHAVTSAAYRAGLNIDEIRNTVGWTKSSQAFNTFYNRPLARDPETFANTILNKCAI